MTISRRNLLIASGLGAVMAVAGAPNSAEAISPSLQGARSGLSWVHGAYLDHLSSNIPLFETDTGKKLDVVEVFLANDSADGMLDSWWKGALGTAGGYIISAPLWPADSSVSVSNQALFTELGKQIQATGKASTSYLRLGWEMNIDFGHWSVFPSNLSAWKDRFREASRALRTAAPGLKIVFNPNEGSSQSGRVTDIGTLAYDLRGTYQFIGIDFYNWDSSMNTIEGWNNRYNSKYGMRYWETKAGKWGKGFSVPEWGGTGLNTQSDDKLYTQQMIRRFKENAKVRPVFEAYFSEPANYFKSAISRYRLSNSGTIYPAQLPVLRDAYKRALTL